MIVAGFDIATTTGCAILDGPKVIHAEAFKAKGGDDGAIIASFRLWMRSMLLSHGVQHAAIEQPLRTPQIDKNGELDPKSSMATYLRLYGLRGAALEICHALNIECLEVNMGTWRASFTGNGHAKKEETLALARQIYPGLKSKDAAEAIGVAWHLNGVLNPRTRDLFAKAS